MDSVARCTIKQDVLSVAISQTDVSSDTDRLTATYPSTCPIMDMTAKVLEYAIRLASHAVGSGQVVKNQLWKTEGEYLA
jgi:hypothetical protein